MFKWIRNNLVAVIFSVSVHALLLVMLVISFDWTPKPEVIAKKPNVVKAVAVDANKVKAELDKLRQAEKRKQKQEQDRIARLKRAEQQAKRKRVEEEKRIAKLKKQQAVLKKKRVAEEKKRKAEQQRLAKLKKQQAAAKKKRVAEEKKRKAEQARLAKLKKEQAALKKKQAEAEKKRIAAEKKRKAEEKKRLAAEKKRKQEAAQRQQELARQLEAEERAQAEAKANREIDRYLVLIRQKVARNWLKPAGSSKGLVSKVKVRLIPGGEVIDVKIIKSSGNAVYDRSVEGAVRKASPLPLPKDPAIAARMYDIDFNFALET